MNIIARSAMGHKKLLFIVFFCLNNERSKASILRMSFGFISHFLVAWRGWILIPEHFRCFPEKFMRLVLSLTSYQVRKKIPFALCNFIVGRPEWTLPCLFSCSLISFLGVLWLFLVITKHETGYRNFIYRSTIKISFFLPLDYKWN